MRYCALFFCLVAGCSSDTVDDVGKPCELEMGEPNMNVLNNEARDCEAQLCIHYDGGSEGPRCSAFCASDADCPRDPVVGCEAGFVCRIFSLLETSGIACQGLCVCAELNEPPDDLASVCAARSP